MGYLHINNLYKDITILQEPEVYAMEKIHGTSAHIRWSDGQLHFFSGGVKHAEFVKLFDAENLKEQLSLLYGTEFEVIINGEAYGGKCQRMSNTYGPALRFVAFDCRINNQWLTVPEAERLVMALGLEFVSYNRIPTDMTSIDAERDADSVQAIRNGCGEGRLREGVVLRPIVEKQDGHDQRLITKHKRAEFGETKTPREVNPDKLAVLAEAKAIAEEWVTNMRLEHVLDKHPEIQSIEQMPLIIAAMLEDVHREAGSEIVVSNKANSAIARATAQLYKQKLKEALYVS